MYIRHPEHVIPPDQQFNNGVLVLAETYDDAFAANQRACGDIIDPTLEIRRDIEAIWQFSSFLAEIIKSDDEDLRAVSEVVYRSVNFTLDVTDSLVDKRALPSLSLDFLADEEGGLADRILNSVSRYLSTRDNIDNLLAKYMPEIDETFLMHHHIEVAAGLVFMSLEQQLADQLITQQAPDIEPSTITGETE